MALLALHVLRPSLVVLALPVSPPLPALLVELALFALLAFSVFV